MADVVVVGGGVGGLAVAIRLGAAGHRVTLLERRSTLGGKLDRRERAGFTFDTGPSLLTLPALYDDLLRAAGTSLDAEVDLVRLDPQVRYHWPDGSTLAVRDDPEATAAGMEALSPGAGAACRRFLERAGRIWEVSERTFLAGPMSGPAGLARRLRSPRDLVTIDAARSLAAAAARAFTDPRLVQWAGRYATYSGSSPFRAPATLACIAHIEAHDGVWYPRGGLDALRAALVRTAERAGVELVTGCDVTGITATAERATGVVTSGGRPIRADVVVADVDADHLYRELLPDRTAQRRLTAARRSTSGFVVLAGVRGATPGVAHHNIWFAADPRREFELVVDRGRFADEPTIYGCVPTVTEPTRAPDGHESWTLLVNAPHDAAVDGDAYRDLILDRLADRGMELRDRLCFTEVVTPADLARRYRAAGGAIYGTSSNGRRTAFLRPGNRGARHGLYLVGGSAHPGGGLPLVAIGARIVADLIRDDGW